MHDIEILAVWFALVIAGMILTILMPRIVSESHGSGADQEEPQRISAHQGSHERVGSMILIGKEI
ncbi:MAG: hypothetical protein A4E19_12990 [Nitrospira sp. SG-bin1]|nr:MAG: hypothetical protein A4E19_12990 [Nitrospira sp. SG-bin1]